MAVKQRVRPFARLCELAQAKEDLGDAVVPIGDFAVYYLLANELARIGASAPGGGPLIIVDGQTAAQIDAIEGARGVAERVYLFGDPPQTWESASNVVTDASGECVGDSELFLVVMSPSLSFAIAGTRTQDGVRGAWTGVRSLVRRLAGELAGADAIPKPPETPEPDALDDTAVSCLMRLTSLLTRQLAMRQRDMEDDKRDLHSVLNILQAISAKRRAHDILYVFVEHIARAVEMSRCSVVRVRAEGTMGYVLASHEDESVDELPIDLDRYPEIVRAMEKGRKVVINDARHDPLTRLFADELAGAGVGAIIVIPLVLYERDVGSLLLRGARSTAPFSLRDISFCEVVASAAASALERANLFESIQLANEKLERLAVTDGLTGLYNHRFFRERLDDELERARRYSVPLSCIMLDVDDFKKVNDTFGHLQGDEILRMIASLTSASVRKSDVVARYGGEELVVIMPQTSLEGALIQAERVRLSISEHRYEGLPEDWRVTVSIGVSMFEPDGMSDAEALIRVADTGLYRAKREGKNRVVTGQLEGE